MFEAIGRFHPLVVHLPIGILMLGLIAAVVTQWEKYAALRPAVGFTLFWGALSAIFACVLGFGLAQNAEDYNPDLLAKHKWSGIACAVFATATWAIYRFSRRDAQFFKGMAWLLSIGTLTAAGHYGGSLTHGEAFLFELFFKEKKDKKEKTVAIGDSTRLKNDPLSISPYESPNLASLGADKKISVENQLVTKVSAQEDAVATAADTRMAYQDLIVPILKAKCYNCHNENKRKGGLRLDGEEFINKGGERGAILVAGAPEKSKILTFCLLPDDDDDHMPPIGKPQITPNEIALLKWWIQKGAAFDKTVADMNGGGKMSLSAVAPSVFSAQLAAKSTQAKGVNLIDTATKSVVLAPAPLAVALPKDATESILLKKTVAIADGAAVKKLTDARVIIADFGTGNNYLTANFINVKNYSPALLDDLKSIENQLIRLKLSNQPVTDKDMPKIAQLKNLTRLNLEKTNVTDAGLAQLKNLSQLEQLNLYGAKISDKGLQQLAQCKNLKVLYLMDTNVTPKGVANLQKILRGCLIDTGGVRFKHPTPDSVKK